MANLEFNDDQFGEIVAAAVMQTITTDSRDILVKEAVKHLLGPSDRSFTTTNLQQAFNREIQKYAQTVIAEILETEAKEQIIKVILAGIKKAFEDKGKEKLIDNISQSIARTFMLDRNWE